MRAAAIVVVLTLMSGCACLEPGPVVYHYGGSGYQFRDLGGDLRRPVSVPEPGALGLMGLGLVGLLLARRQRK